jgi:hypothetical protein
LLLFCTATRPCATWGKGRIKISFEPSKSKYS